MEELPLVRISVRNLVEFLLRSGDIDNRGSAASALAMQEGSRMHRKIQRRMGPSYQAEVSLSIQIHMERYVLSVEGRADGVIAEDEVTIDEIKGVYQNLDHLSEPAGVHLAQAMCYAYIYAKEHDLEYIYVQMTYCNLDTEEIKRFSERFEFERLKAWFEDLIGQYAKWADFQSEWRRAMTKSAAGLEFPYPYREGQRELAQDVYRAILRKKNLFIQAPTGAGKTLSTVYPAIKAVGEGLADKIFYLTAKTVTKAVAGEAFALLGQRGYRAKVAFLTAKEKMCLCGETDCNPVACPYAKGHYDRVNDAVYDLLQKESFYTREVFLSQAEAYRVCPFELCLDTAFWSDDIICDYNYVFDPNAYLKRFFAEGQKGSYIFLADEAHNLVERGRKMYSASLCKEDFLAMQKIARSKDGRLFAALGKCNKMLLEYKRECDSYRARQDDQGGFLFALMRLGERMDVFLQEQADIPERKEVSEFYFNLRNFLNIYERLDERYVIYTEHGDGGRFYFRLFCVDPSRNLQERMDKGRATVLFSATLLPIQYYKDMLSTRTDDYAVYAKTSFEKEQKLLLIGTDVSSRYARRNEKEFFKIASYIRSVVSAKKGNYMIFFPSYKLMDQVYRQFLAIAPEGLRLIRQESGMTEEEREAFLKEFEGKEEGRGEAGKDEEAGEGKEAEGREEGEEGKEASGSGEEKEPEEAAECEEAEEGKEASGSREAGGCEGAQERVESEGCRNASEPEKSEGKTGKEEPRPSSLAAFCVLGGIFAEGIDLKEERLIGAVIVGTGLPQIGNEREILKRYFDEKTGDGFDYAYRYPGMNKVLQAAGRVIRTAKDRGVIALLDERFLEGGYLRLFPREWEDYEACSQETAEDAVLRFWEKL